MQLLPFMEAAAAAAAAAAVFTASTPLKIDMYEGKIAIQWGEALSFDADAAIRADDVLVRECDDGIRGRGAFVSRPGGLERGTCLGQYSGEALSATEFSDRYAGQQREPEYVMRIDNDLFVDASMVVTGSVGGDGASRRVSFHPAFINHARSPKCNVIRRCSSRRPPMVELFTAEAVAEGSELLMDYGEGFWRGREAVEITD